MVEHGRSLDRWIELRSTKAHEHLPSRLVGSLSPLKGVPKELRRTIRVREGHDPLIRLEDPLPLSVTCQLEGDQCFASLMGQHATLYLSGSIGSLIVRNDQKRSNSHGP